MNHKEKKQSTILTSKDISGIPPAPSPADPKIFIRGPRGPKKADNFLRQQRRWQFLRAGLAAAFNAPLAGFLLTVQVNRSEPGRAVHQVQQAATSV